MKHTMRRKSSAIALAVGAALLFSTPADAQTAQGGEVRLEALAPQNFEAGRCGLFIWAQAEQPVFVLAAYDTPSAAVVRIDGRERTLPRTSVEGERVSGQHEVQTFSDGELTLILNLDGDNVRALRDGALYERASLRLSDRAGWQTLMPVRGLSACRT
jgi:hypothetical protein